MVFLKINWLVCNDRGSTNLALNDLHSFDMTQSDIILYYIAFRSHAGIILCALRQSEPVLYCNAGSDWLRAYTE